MCMISVFSGTPSNTVRTSRAFLSHALYPTRDMQKARHHTELRPKSWTP